MYKHLKVTVLYLFVAILACPAAYSQTPKEWRKQGDSSVANKNFEQAAKEYQKAVDEGDEISALKLCWLIHETGVPSPDPNNLYWLLKLMAEKNYPDAQFFTGYLLANGIGIGQNMDEAVKWYTEAAKKDITNAQYELALLYDGNKGVAQNNNEMMKWLCKASALGHIPARQMLAEKSKTISYTPETLPSIPEVIPVKGGTYMRGRFGDKNKSESPVREITLSPFSMGKYEVTNSQYCEFLNEWGYRVSSLNKWIELDGYLGKERCRIYLNGDKFQVDMSYENHPVLFVQWAGAMAYTLWLSEKTGKSWRLPTEAEWEYAARGASNDSMLFSGSEYPEEVGWLWNNSNAMCHEVGKLNPNQLGIYDITGNAWEWCMDFYRKKFYRNEKKIENPQGPVLGSYKILRGGGWDSFEAFSHVWARNFLVDPNHLGTIGFRVVLKDEPLNVKKMKRYKTEIGIIRK